MIVELEEALDNELLHFNAGSADVLEVLVEDEVFLLQDNTQIRRE